MTPPEKPAFSDALTSAVQARGLSLERIRARLAAASVPVSIATLSYWQSGRSMPTRSRSYHTLVELERILNVEPGYLTQHTHTADGRTRRDLFEWQSVVPGRDLAARIIDDLGIDMQGQLTRVLVQDLIRIRADRTEASQDVRVTWRTERQGLHRWAVVLEQDAADPDTVPTLEPLFGCTVGEVVEVPEHHLVVAEMLAPRPMQRGELFHCEYRIGPAPTTQHSFQLRRALADPVKAIGLCVDFDAAATPSRLEAGISATVDTDPTDVVPVPLDGRQAQFVWTDAKPGVYSLCWDWD